MRAALRSDFGSPPASTDPGYQACKVGCVGGLGVLSMRYGCNPTQRVVEAVRFSQIRRPATLLSISRHVLRVGTRNPC